MAACALAMQSREKEYLEVAGRYNREELGQIAKALGLLINEMEADAFTDKLGCYYLDISSKSSKKDRGEFYTPDSVSELVARLIFNPDDIIADGQPYALQEPCCGAGGMILKAAEQLSPVRLDGDKSYVDLLRVTATDINPVACDMTYVNTTLWAIPTRVIHSNYLTGTVNIGWKNIHWVRVGEDQRLSAEKMVDIMRGMEEVPENEVKPQPQKPSNVVGDVGVQRNPEPPGRENYDQPELF